MTEVTNKRGLEIQYFGRKKDLVNQTHIELQQQLDRDHTPTRLKNSVFHMLPQDQYMKQYHP